MVTGDGFYRKPLPEDLRGGNFSLRSTPPVSVPITNMDPDLPEYSLCDLVRDFSMGSVFALKKCGVMRVSFQVIEKPIRFSSLTWKQGKACIVYSVKADVH